MQFHIDADSGSAITGWIAPDNPSVIPRISIVSPSRQQHVEIEANVLRSDLKELGLHSTGMAGFTIDEKIMPGVQSADDIEIRHSQSRLLLYRRFHETTHVERKLFLYALSTMPQTQIEACLAGLFAQSYQAIERYPFDTLFSILNTHFTRSLLVSGRPRFFRYQQLLREKDFLIATLLREPYEELAERLLFIRYASSNESPEGFTEYLTGLEPLVPLVREIDFASKSSITAAFQSLSDAQREALSDPSVRTIACGLDESPERKHVSIALDRLAAMDLVGVTSRFEDFRTILGEMLGVEISNKCQLSRVSWVPKIAGHLKHIEAVKYLLALDLEMYSHAHGAISRGLNAR